ncbi:Protein transport protein Sec24-like [Phytophthora rubi]|uniref:Protein transport protein Sec24-like n=2 Tax=Phytophthora rubi TaxID=129364 RepID=A0A6A4DSZ8_9STRA|nr:Protein transport protein Sec24-like [Phytophthora rubi]KAE9313763.1 Protein transport protein Sec24-like [Phytophthora rubi]
MNNPPYQSYGGPPQQQQQQPPQSQPPRANAFRPFNPAQVNAPLSGSGDPAFMRSASSGPPSAGSLNAPPPQQQQQMGGGAPRGFAPPNRSFSGPASQPTAPPPQQFGSHPAPMSGGGGYGPPRGGPPNAQPQMMRGPPPAGAAPPMGQGMRSAGPPPPMNQGPPNGQNGLTQQFSNMGLNGPPGPGAVVPPRGPPPTGGAPPPPMGGAMAPPGAPQAMHQQPPQQPTMNQQPPQKAFNSNLPSGNFQQPNDMMGDGYGGQQGFQGQQMQQASPLTEEMVASQCDPRYMRLTVGALPHSMEHANKSKLTYGLIIRPLAPPDEGEDLDVVNFGPSGVVRCRHCRTYINPFVQWVDNGRRWRCNLCGVSNDVASSYFCHLGANQQRQDRDERPELNSGSVEIVAPSEYMMRPPQPPCFMFVIDVSATAVASGSVQIAVDTIREQLDNLPGAPRTRVGFLTYDSSIHFYNLKSTLKAPQMMVVADLDELFIPIPDELLVNLSDSREVVEMLLETLPAIHQNSRSAETALGPAIRVAFKLMSSIGGKMLVFQNSLPSTGNGALRNRDNPRLYGTDKEHTLLQPVDTFYRTNAIDFCRQQVSVDQFLFSSMYTDIASMGSLSKYSAGQVYYYPAFNAERDGEKFRRELAHSLVRETSWEAVMRVRCTKGMRLASFYGNFFLRGPDLLALPTCNADSTFAVEITHSDALLTSSTISVQAGLLYTNSGGERRIRVHTVCIPVTKLFAELFRQVDQDALCNIMAKNALEVALKTGLDSGRSRLQTQCADIVRAYRNSGAYGAKQPSGYQLHLPESLQLLPLYIMSLLKNSTLRGGTDLNVDERTFLQYELNNMPVELSRVFIYPRMFALHNMPPEAGFPAEDDAGAEGVEGSSAKSIVLPPVINLSIERLQCDGVFLLDDTLCLYLWVGRSAPPELLQSLFGVPSMEGVDCSQLQLLAPHDDTSNRVDAILSAIRAERLPYQNVVIMREGDPAEGRFFWKLVEDRASFPGGSYSYSEYLGQISRMSISGGTGGR